MSKLDLTNVFERIYELPKMEKDEDGYKYNEKYKNVFFIYNNKGHDVLYYVPEDRNKMIELPLNIISEIIEKFENKISDKIVDEEKLNNNIDEKFKELEDNLDGKITNIEKEIDEKLNVNNKYIKNQLEGLITEKNVQNKIDDQLKSVHENYQKIARKLVEEKTEELKKEIMKANPNKPKTSTLTSLIKEEGFSIEEIKELHESGLI